MLSLRPLPIESENMFQARGLRRSGWWARSEVRISGCGVGHPSSVTCSFGRASSIECAHSDMERERKRALLRKLLYSLLTVEERRVMSLLVGVSAPAPRFKAYVPVAAPSAVFEAPSWKR